MIWNRTEFQKPVSDLITKNLQQVVDNMNASQIVQELGTRIVTRTFLQHENSTMYYISVFPLGNRAEETIDTILTATFDSDKWTVSGDVAWSTGQLVKDVLILHISSEYSDQALDLVSSKLKRACKQCHDQYMSLLESIKYGDDPTSSFSNRHSR